MRKKRPEPEEGNPWHRLNQKLEEKLTQVRSAKPSCVCFNK